MRKRCIGIQTLIICHMQHIHSVRKDLFFDSVKLVTNSQCFQIAAQLSSQTTAFGHEFLTHFRYLTFFYFAVYKNAVHVFSIRGLTNRVTCK